MDINNPAGFGNRFVARILDLIIIFIVTGFISLLIYGEFYNDTNFRPIDILGFIYALIIPVFWYGYTLGRRMAGNRIVRVDGEKVGIGTMILRDIVAGIAYILTLGIGLIVSAFMVGLREDKRAIHDFIAQTYVTTNPPNKGG
ncbi:RDD family protein [Paraliobacillus zengyii]|uniref:RDD family protein n=1 Tax=Paraliobacillus zengyii TaxID=2213194 RepID=UPI000DD312C7|nr:RDD family protein [Paraliobacillus zengyii]